MREILVTRRVNGRGDGSKMRESIPRDAGYLVGLAQSSVRSKGGFVFSIVCDFVPVLFVCLSTR